MRYRVLVRYLLFCMVFAAVMAGLVLHSYLLLVGMAVLSVGLAAIGDHLENAASRPFRHWNELHQRKKTGSR